MSPVDRIAHLNRWRFRPLSEKALLTFGMLLLDISLPPWPTAVLVAVVMVLATLVGARVPARVWLACVAGPTGFLLAGTLSVLLQVDGHGIGLAPGGLSAAAGLAARSEAGLACLLFLALTTPASDLMTGLRRLGLPAEIVEMALLTYRFVFLLADTAATMNAAQAARLGHIGLRRRLRCLGVLIANLLPRALDRARRLEVGLAARGWNGEMRVLSRRTPSSIPTLAGILILETAMLITGLLVQ
ncbi:cobalt ECF transporter T component CbiQ [Telmatospirillum siberiense]|uniref:Cobalt ECF transporter T component CbiQ n=1 Tax=Telmatospirillum siberiense TaxID=382514 RepID=A0A2N3PWY6_9PROT|nr:cobalt ECF transporter T component CbiQ [Telmatospirillum siberiense]PKU24924.1 cobalt ECF transporter T component CbiQ [Telmatospirillum siberiense]